MRARGPAGRALELAWPPPPPPLLLLRRRRAGAGSLGVGGEVLVCLPWPPGVGGLACLAETSGGETHACVRARGSRAGKRLGRHACEINRNRGG
nr:unnamed protein product [Digitaria exilis]